FFLADVLEGPLEVFDVGVQFILPDIYDGPAADLRLRPYRALGHDDARAGRQHDTRVFVGAREGERVARWPAKTDRAVDLFKAREASARIGHPVDLAVLAVIDDIQAKVGLFAYNLGNRALDAILICLPVVSGAELLVVEDRNEISWTRQAAGVRGQDSIGAVFHARPIRSISTQFQRDLFSDVKLCQPARLCGPALGDR